jgi:hypothetical protein
VFPPGRSRHWPGKPAPTTSEDQPVKTWQQAHLSLTGISCRWWLAPKEQAQRSDEPLLVLRRGPAALGGQDPVHVRGESGVCDVGSVGELEFRVKGVADGKGGDDPGLAGVALAPDLLQELGRVGIDLGRRGQDVHDLRGPFHEVAADAGEGPDQRRRVWFVARCLDVGAISEGYGLVVTAEGDIQDGLEQRALGGEQAVEGGQRGVGGGGDRFEGGGGIAVLDEQGAGSGWRRPSGPVRPTSRSGPG